MGASCAGRPVSRPGCGDLADRRPPLRALEALGGCGSTAGHEPQVASGSEANACGDPRGELQLPGRARTQDEPSGRDVRDDTQYAEATIEEDDVDRETHADRVQTPE